MVRNSCIILILTSCRTQIKSNTKITLTICCSGRIINIFQGGSLWLIFSYLIREYIQFMLQMQSKSVSNEILDFFEHSLSAPSKSAFTRQRYKPLPEGWDFLFHSFVNQCRTLSDNLYNSYRLLACDGSDVDISRNPADERTFIHEGKKGYNAIHINALYDTTNKTYCDLSFDVIVSFIGNKIRILFV